MVVSLLILSSTVITTICIITGTFSFHFQDALMKWSASLNGTAAVSKTEVSSALLWTLVDYPLASKGEYHYFHHPLLTRCNILEKIANTLTLLFWLRERPSLTSARVEVDLMRSLLRPLRHLQHRLLPWGGFNSWATLENFPWMSAALLLWSWTDRSQDGLIGI